MKKISQAIRNFFLPPADAKTFIRILPLVLLAIVMLLLFTAATYAWEETNTVSFCGLTCHTMPPQYVTHQISAHTNVACEDCHMGRDRLVVLIPRKIRYSYQTGSAMLLNNYEYPIVAKNMAPAREACENCHKPEVFSNDKLVEIRHYAQDEANTATSTFLVMKIGGGLSRQGLGYGIHWHIENPVFYYANDEREQDIPYVMVKNADGSTTEYIDTESGFSASTIKPEDLKQMDCITCHNRTAHLVKSPQASVDDLMRRGLVSPSIPNIKQKAVEVMSVEYHSIDEAMQGIESLVDYYQNQQSDFYTSNTSLFETAVAALKETYQNTHFPDQEMDWKTHPNNLSHLDSPGCFRCHDGKHLTQQNESIRLECNICHSVPVVSEPNQIMANVPVSKGFEPESHKNSNWISLHRTIFDETCAGCHTVEDAGGTSNISFCSNSVCHGAKWEFAGFDAPRLRAIIEQEAQSMITPTPLPSPTPVPDDIGVEIPSSSGATPTPTPGAVGPLTYELLQPVITQRCGSCHGSSAMKGLNVLSYAKLMEGGQSGPAIIPGDPDNSLFVQVQAGSQSHFGQFTMQELEQVIQWIREGAAEK